MTVPTAPRKVNRLRTRITFCNSSATDAHASSPLRLVEVEVSIAEPNPAISIFHDWGAYQPFGPCPTSGLIRIVWRAHRRKIRAVGSLEIASGAGELPFFQLQPEDVVMRVQDLMAREVHSCQAEDSLETAAQLMWDHDCGCIPVCMRGNDDASKMIGVITDRDICMHALFQGMALRDLHVRDAMAKDIHVCHPGDSFAQAEKTMQEARIRRLPVIDEKGSLVGMISLADLAKLAARERAHPRKDITETEIGDTLATICGAPTWSIAV